MSEAGVLLARKMGRKGRDLRDQCNEESDDTTVIAWNVLFNQLRRASWKVSVFG